MTQKSKFSFNLIQLDEIDSTNNYLRQLSRTKELDEFTVVTARYQTAGKGQRGNYWESEKNMNLMFSLLAKPYALPIKYQFLLSEVVSLALLQTLSQFTDNISIKWPNDIYWKDKKISGILIEHDLMDDKISQSILGVGLNVNQVSFYSDAPNPISLAQITNKTLPLDDILNLFILRFKELYNLLNTNQWNKIEALYIENLYRSKGFHLYADQHGVFSAKLKTVDSDGTFRLTDEQGKERAYLFKEVQYII